MKFLQRWKIHFFLLIALFVFPLFAIKNNGAKAVEGIIWGVWPGYGIFPPISIHQMNVNYGVYDHEKKFSQAKKLAFEHFYYQWNEFSALQFRMDMQYAMERNRWPLITIEPYPFHSDSDRVENLFSDILNGKYDEPINRIHDELKAFGKPVFLRWGHEMEKVTGRYPWAQDNYHGYIEAYRYFFNKIQDPAIEAYFVWSPVGNREMMNYWPGADYVHCVGVSVYAYPDWDWENHGKVRSFPEIFTEKYNWAQRFGKNIMITEMGVTGDARYQAEWMYGAFKSFPEYPLLKSVIYFNAKDSEQAWDKKYKVPDWHIDSTLFEHHEYTGLQDNNGIN